MLPSLRVVVKQQIGISPPRVLVIATRLPSPRPQARHSAVAVTTFMIFVAWRQMDLTPSHAAMVAARPNHTLTLSCHGGSQTSRSEVFLLSPRHPQPRSPLRAARWGQCQAVPSPTRAARCGEPAAPSPAGVVRPSVRPLVVVLTASAPAEEAPVPFADPALSRATAGSHTEPCCRCSRGHLLLQSALQPGTVARPLVLPLGVVLSRHTRPRGASGLCLCLLFPYVHERSIGVINRGWMTKATCTLIAALGGSHYCC